MTTNKTLIKNLDYYLNDEGNCVFTSHYLIKRGHCCKSGCLHCPYGYSEKTDPNVPAEFTDAWSVYEDEAAELEDDEFEKLDDEIS